MSNDIILRVQADYAAALKSLQAFVGQAGKTMESVPKIFQLIEKSVVSLNDKVDQIGKSRGPDELYKDLSKLPDVVRQLAGSVDNLSGKVNQLGKQSGAKNLTEDLKRANKEASALAMSFKAIGASAAGFQAGKMVLQPHLDRMVDYDTQLAHLVNVGMAGESVAARKAGKSEFNNVIMDAIRQGGGTREQGLDTLSKIMGSGVINDADAKTMLPTVLRGATASGATAEQIADIGIRSMQNFGFKAEDLPRVLDMAIKSGNLGGFELKDMAKWLPAQMAEAATLGMKGEKGLAQLLALNQASITTAGSTDMAGNNVVNLLSKINSNDTQNDFKKQGINLTGSLQAAVAKGIDPVTAFAHLIDKVMSKDKNYLALEKKRTSSSNSAEQAEILEKQLQLAEGTAIGKVLQDRQARGAYLGFKKQGAEFTKQIDATINDGAKGTMDGNFDVLSGTPGYMRQQAQNDALNAQNDALQKLVPALEWYWQGVSKTAREHPLLTTAMEGGKIAVATLAAGAGTASIVMALLSKNAGSAAVSLGLLRGTAAASGGVPGAVGGFKGAMKLNAAMAAGVTALDIYGIASNDALSAKEKKIGYTSAAGGLAGALGGAAAGAAIGSIVPGIGTVGGFLVGGALAMGGNYLGSKGGAALGQSMFGDSPNDDKVARALQDTLKSNPIEGKLQIKIAFDEAGKPYVANQSMQGGFRLDTGPMLTH